jgi:DNA topoisomerase-3
VGHVFTLLEPQDIDPKYKSWMLSLLPILPERFALKPLPEHKQRIQILKELLERPDVHCVINACDAAREGELIFREVYEFHGCKKWVRRLWLQSMTPEAIRDGFGKGLRDGVDLDGLGNAAHCRAQSDWLIGMNATRAFSERLRIPGDRTPWSVGRVQTPTLALLVTRELEILGHDPRPFFRVLGRFEATT